MRFPENPLPPTVNFLQWLHEPEAVRDTPSKLTIPELRDSFADVKAAANTGTPGVSELATQFVDILTKAFTPQDKEIIAAHMNARLATKPETHQIYYKNPVGLWCATEIYFGGVDNVFHTMTADFVGYTRLRLDAHTHASDVLFSVSDLYYALFGDPKNKVRFYHGSFVLGETKAYLALPTKRSPYMTRASEPDLAIWKNHHNELVSQAGLSDILRECIPSIQTYHNLRDLLPADSLPGYQEQIAQELIEVHQKAMKTVEHVQDTVAVRFAQNYSVALYQSTDLRTFIRI